MPTFPIPRLQLGTSRVIIRFVSVAYFAIRTGTDDKNNILACDTDVNVTLSFGGRSWSISSADFAMTTTSGNSCIGAFFVLGSTTPAWIIGDTFLVRLCFLFLEKRLTPSTYLSEKRLLRV